jgi:hypothetical protein
MAGYLGDSTARRRRGGDEYLAFQRQVVRRLEWGQSERAVARIMNASRGSVRHVAALYRNAARALASGTADEEQRALYDRLTAPDEPVGNRSGAEVPAADLGPFGAEWWATRNNCGMLLSDELAVRQLLAAGSKYYSGSWHDPSGQPCGNDFRALDASA